MTFTVAWASLVAVLWVGTWLQGLLTPRGFATALPLRLATVAERSRSTREVQDRAWPSSPCS